MTLDWTLANDEVYKEWKTISEHGELRKGKKVKEDLEDSPPSFGDYTKPGNSFGRGLPGRQGPISKFLLPIDAKDATPIEITIPSGYGASYIGKVLYEEGLINNKAVFKVYVDFMGKSSSLRSGTYILSKNMDIAQMVDIMCTGNPPRKTIDLRVTEGTDVKMIGEQLVQLGVLESPEEFYELCKTGEAFMDFTFIAAIEDDPSEARKYKLEGYLFPDTYEIYSDSSPDVIINKMLVKFLEVFNVGYSERAEELGLTMDEVVTLASLVEREAKTMILLKCPPYSITG